MTFDRNANLRAWRAANPERYAAQRQAEYARRKKVRAAKRKAKLAEQRELKRAARKLKPTGRCCMGPHLPTCPKFKLAQLIEQAYA